MRYFVGGTKGLNFFYHGNRRYWLYLCGFVLLSATNIILFNEELMSVLIKDIIWLCIVFGLLEFVFHPKSHLYLDFNESSIELGYARKKDNKIIEHRNLKSIDTTISDIIIITKDGMNYEIPLSNFHFDEVKGIKGEVFKIQQKMSNSYEYIANE